MKNLIKVGMFLMLMSPSALAQEKSSKPDGCLTTKQVLYGTFAGTRVEGRIVKVRIKKHKGKPTDVFIIWHPSNADYIMEDTISIIESVNKTIPNFSFVSLKALHPEYMRWSKYILWEAKITKNAFINIKNFQRRNIDKK